MEYETKEVIKKIGIGVVSALVAGAGVSGYFISQPAPEPMVINNTLPAEKEIILVENKTIEYKEVPFEDTSKIDYMNARLVDMDLIDEDYLAYDVFIAEDMAISVAIEHAIKEMPDMLDDEGIIKDEDEFKVLKIYDDLDDIEIKKSDFDESEYKFVISFKVEDTKKEDKFKINATVKIEDGDVELTKVEKAE